MNYLQVDYSRKASQIVRDFVIARRQEFSRGNKHKAGLIQHGRTVSDNRRVIAVFLEGPTYTRWLEHELKKAGCYVLPFISAMTSTSLCQKLRSQITY